MEFQAVHSSDEEEAGAAGSLGEGETEDATVLTESPEVKYFQECRVVTIVVVVFSCFMVIALRAWYNAFTVLSGCAVLWWMRVGEAQYISSGGTMRSFFNRLTSVHALLMSCCFVVALNAISLIYAAVKEVPRETSLVLFDSLSMMLHLTCIGLIRYSDLTKPLLR
eukprot:TRINITY_DN20706_c0_g1_i1.p1 TRINITY_DN20706_c0_g1~~TRINITY_DN20706_c0_g1_i1.p1  ORF type:complete len:180 (+),score=13.50 TRINITY_DN20706_c0_g1_i1:43-540(+)